MTSETAEEEEAIRKASAALKMAVEYDKQKNYNDAVDKYTDGIMFLTLALQFMNKTDEKYKDSKQKLADYTVRKEELSRRCYVEAKLIKREIKEKSIGHGYDKIFSQCCNDKLCKVDVRVPKIGTKAETDMFIRLCELLVMSARKLESITLETHSESESVIGETIGKLGASLKKREICLTVSYVTESHTETEISFDNGFSVTIDTGLDYFHPVDPWTIGSFEMNLRPCKKTVVFIKRPKSISVDMVEGAIRKASAASKMAVDYDVSDYDNDAIDKYSDAILFLTLGLRLMERTHRKYAKATEKLEKYKERRENLKNAQKSRRDPQRDIRAGSIGHGYDKIFNQCCNDKLKSITIQEPYVRNDMQKENFVRFCELMVMKARNLKRLTLVTHDKTGGKSTQEIEALRVSLLDRGIELETVYSKTAHDRPIEFDNGCKLEIGRGLNIFDIKENSRELGEFEMNLRPCLETRVSFWPPISN